MRSVSSSFTIGHNESGIQRSGAFVALFLAFCLVALSCVVPSAASAADKSYFVKSPDGINIAVQETGDIDGPSIVFVHGLLGSHLNWAKQIESPELSKFRLITFDLRGHGLSDKPNDVESYRDGRRWAGDLRAVLDATKVKKPVLVGWSLGAAVITNYVSVYGDDNLGGIFYVGGVIELKPDLITAHPEVYAGLASDDLDVHLDAVREFLALCFSQQPDRTTFERLLSNAAMASWIMTRTAPSMSVAAAEALPKVTVPLTTLYGGKDALVTVKPSLERAWSLNASVRSNVYPMSGHAPFLEEAERFNHDLADFRNTVPTE